LANDKYYPNKPLKFSSTNKYILTKVKIKIEININNDFYETIVMLTNIKSNIIF
jgi:hypothetical protein